MKNKTKKLILWFCCAFALLYSSDVNSMSRNFDAGFAPPDSIVPKVFIKAQNEKLEELMTTQYPKQVLYAYNDNAQTAFSDWANMIWEMEKFGIQSGFDIRGIKAYATFYYDKKGNIRHIAYSLKGNSKYFKPEELEKFFIQFMGHHHLQKVNPKNKYNFQHEFTLFLPYPRL